MFCHAIFGIFCLTLPIGTSTAEMQNMGFGGVVTVKAPGWYAFLGMGTDEPYPLDPKKLAKYCDANGRCIQYYRHCKDPAHPVSCEFDFALGGTSIPLRITADNDEAGRLALQDIGVALDPDRPQIAVPVSTFNVESKYETAPTP